MEAQKMTDELFPDDGEGGAGGDLDALVTQIDLDLVDDYPASDPRWAESVPDGELLGGRPPVVQVLLNCRKSLHNFHVTVIVRRRLGFCSAPTTTRASLASRETVF